MCPRDFLFETYFKKEETIITPQHELRRLSNCEFKVNFKKYDILTKKFYFKVNHNFNSNHEERRRAEIHQNLLSQFSFLVDFLS